MTDSYVILSFSCCKSLSLSLSPPKHGHANAHVRGSKPAGVNILHCIFPLSLADTLTNPLPIAPLKTIFQAAASDELDLQDIFADYFNDDGTGNITNANAAADLFSNALFAQQQQQQLQQQQQVVAHHAQQQQLQQQVNQQQQQHQLAVSHQQQLAANAAAAVAQQHLSLPTGQGIQTAWHAGSLPVLQQQQQQQGSNNIISIQQPSAKRSKGEELFLPTSQQQQQNNIAGNGAGDGNIAITQQQYALAQAASGVGALSGRLGFSFPNNHTQQQQQQQVQQQVQQQAAAQGINLPVGIGVKFNPMGNIIPQGQVGVSGIQALANGNIAAPVGAINVAAFNNLTSMAMAGNSMTAATAQEILAASARSAGAANTQQTALGTAQSTVPSEDDITAERRLRNREHAKRSRVRKKFMLESLQEEVRKMQEENSTLRMLVQKHIPTKALKIIDECCAKSVLFGTSEEEEQQEKKEDPQDKKEGNASNKQPLLRSDFSLIESLTSGQQNFTLSDPRLPDNPIVFASPGFYELTGYTREEVLGRNCRFLQGAGTDKKAVDVIRTAVANGTDATVCLLNYKADGTPFWNQLFVAALRDAEDCIVNYVSFIKLDCIPLFCSHALSIPSLRLGCKL